MHLKVLFSLLVCAAFVLPAAPADAALVIERKIKRWPEEDRQLARALDVWMTDEEMTIFLKLKKSEDRVEFLKETGYLKRWKQMEEDKDPTFLEAIKTNDVVEGMSKDQVFMSWDKPVKIRDEFKREAYVKVLWYEFEIDRKGKEFLVRPDSETAYKNEIVTRHVYLYNDRVHAVVEAGTEEAADIVDQILAAEAKKEEARKAAIEAQTKAGAASVEGAEEEAAKPEEGAEGDPAATESK